MSGANADSGSPNDDDVFPSLREAVLAAHQGKRSLGETYWLWLVVPMAVWRAIAQLLNATSLSLYLENKFLFYFVYGAVELGSLVWLYYFGFGVFRSAAHATSAVWSTIACILVVISFLASPIVVFLNILGLAGIGTGMMSPQSEADSINLQLPKRVDNSTTMLHVDYADGKMVFRYLVNTPASDDFDWENIDRNLILNDCSRHEAQFESGILKSVTFRYEQASGNPVHEAVLDSKVCSPENRARVRPPLTGEKLLEEETAVMNRRLPRRLDNITTLTGVSYANGVVQYQYRLDTRSVNLAVLQNNFRVRGCTQFKTQFAGGQLTRVEFRYLLSDNSTQVIDLQKKDCS